MTVQKMFRFSGYASHHAIRDINGEYYIFYDTPARHITAADLKPAPYYRECGRLAEEAPGYMYRMYGLQKE